MSHSNTVGEHSYTDIIVRHEGQVSWVYFNRPQAMNAMAVSTVREMRHAFLALGQRDDTRVVVLSGKGRAFCAGADLTSALPSNDGPSAEPSFLDEATAMENALTGLKKPVIAAVNGVCCAGGLEVALMCDFIIASDNAKLGDAHANFGALPGGGTTARLARVVGPNMARFIFLTGVLLPAAQMQQIGMVSVVTSPEALESTVQEIANNMTTKSPLGLRHMKSLINAAFDHPLSSAIQLEKLTSTVYMGSHDAAEGGRAFAEKRSPQFKGY